MRRLARAAVTILVGFVLALPPSPAQCAPIAFDHAGDPAYDDGWQTGDDGGYGFHPWVLSGGNFKISSSTGNNSSPPPPDGDIDSDGGLSWAIDSGNMLPPPSSNALATRKLISPLKVTQAVSVDFDSVMPPNAESGISLRDASGALRIRVFDLGAAYAITDASGYRAFAPGGTAMRGLEVAIILTGPDTYQLEYAKDGEPPSVISGLLAGIPRSSIDTIVLDRSGFSGTFGYFNKVQITPEPTGCVLLGVLAALLIQGRERDRHGYCTQIKSCQAVQNTQGSPDCLTADG